MMQRNPVPAARLPHNWRNRVTGCRKKRLKSRQSNFLILNQEEWKKDMTFHDIRPTFVSYMIQVLYE
jgi:hypothetical protein